MALPDILETIRAESEETASRLVGEAEAEAEELLARARAEAGSEEQRLGGSFDERIRLERARILSRSHLDAARARRVAREDVYGRAIDEVTARLADKRASDDYRELLGSLLDEAVVILPEATEIRVDPGDVPTIERLLDSRSLDLTVETEETPLGGLVLAAPGRTVDNTLATRLTRADRQLRFVAGEIIPELRGGGE